MFCVYTNLCCILERVHHLNEWNKIIASLIFMIFGWFSFDPFILQKILQRFQWHLIQFKKSTVSSSCCSFYAIRIYMYISISLLFFCDYCLAFCLRFVFSAYFGRWRTNTSVIHCENDAFNCVYMGKWQQKFYFDIFLKHFSFEIIYFLFFLLIFILCYSYFSIIHIKTKNTITKPISLAYFSIFSLVPCYAFQLFNINFQIAPSFEMRRNSRCKQKQDVLIIKKTLI